MARASLLLLCLFQMAATFAYVVQHGRLSIVPMFDDVAYLVDGLGRYATIQTGGLAGLIASFGTTVAHAPLTSMISALGLLLSWPEPWGPYLISTLWIPVSALLLWRILDGVPEWSRFGVIAAVLAAPIFGMSIAEFRPDVGWGLLTGLSIALLACVDLSTIRRVEALTLGALVGLAAIAKPSALPATLSVLGVAALAQTLVPVLIGKVRFRQSAKGLIFVIIGAAIVSAPYLIVSWQHIVNYIIEVAFSNNDVWKTKGTFYQQIKFYLTYGVAWNMLGWMWYIWWPTLILGAATLAWRRDWLSLMRFSGLLLAVFVAYLFSGISGVKSMLIGSLVYGCIIASTVWAAGAFLKSVRIVPSGLVAAAGLVVFSVFWTPVVGMIHNTDPRIAATDAANRSTYPFVAQAMKKVTGRVPVIFLVAPEPIYDATLQYYALIAGINGRFVNGTTWSEWNLFDSAIDTSDVIIVQEPGIAGQNLSFDFPSFRFQQAAIDKLSADQSFSGQKTYTDDDGKSVWVFIRSSKP